MYQFIQFTKVMSSSEINSRDGKTPTISIPFYTNHDYKGRLLTNKDGQLLYEHNKALPDLRSSVSGNIKHTFSTTYWIFHSESVTKSERSNVTFSRNACISCEPALFNLSLGWVKISTVLFEMPLSLIFLRCVIKRIVAEGRYVSIKFWLYKLCVHLKNSNKAFQKMSLIYK